MFNLLMTASETLKMLQCNEGVTSAKLRRRAANSLSDLCGGSDARVLLQLLRRCFTFTRELLRSHQRPLFDILVEVVQLKQPRLVDVTL